MWTELTIFYRRRLWFNLLEQIHLYFDWNITMCCSWGSIIQWVSINSENNVKFYDSETFGIYIYKILSLIIVLELKNKQYWPMYIYILYIYIYISCSVSSRGHIIYSGVIFVTQSNFTLKIINFPMSLCRCDTLVRELQNYMSTHEAVVMIYTNE